VAESLRLRDRMMDEKRRERGEGGAGERGRGREGERGGEGGRGGKESGREDEGDYLAIPIMHLEVRIALSPMVPC
jgi:hypothetical protein